MLSMQDLELGFERYLDLLMGDERVAREFERSRGEFFAAPEAARLPGAERRHLEWFLLERPSAELGAVPVQAWRDAWLAGSSGAPADLGPSLAQSLAGAFEVTSLVRGEGMWVRDLFTLGEHPVAEPRASLGIEPGDLLVGRLFPAGGGAFLLSPAASVFRNEALLAAVRSDLAEMRAARRGVLRVQQLELERLFHGPGSVPVAAPDPDVALERARGELAELGLAPAESERALTQVRRALRDGDGRVLTEVLNRLAFETAVDLAAVRLVLVELWDTLAPARGPAASDANGEAGAADAEAALAAFDRGRAQGKDLEQLFRELERDLGVDEVDDPSEESADQEAAGAPDFPGVVGALVEEFLWELEREQGEEAARAAEPLRALGLYGHDIGVIEELSPPRIVDFGARWSLDRATEEGGRPEELVALLHALAAFCRWCEERQGIELWGPLEGTLESLRGALPRHLALRHLARAGAGAGAFRVERVEGGRARLRPAAGGDDLELALSAGEGELLREGDLARVARDGDEPVLGATYPAELAELLALS